MIRTVLELALAPALVGAATFASRRWGARIGGLVSAFPAVVGPLLLITAQERGPSFTARTATGTLFGLIALAGFVLVYARVATRAGWSASLLAGWAGAGAIAGLAGLTRVQAALAIALIAAAVALVSAQRTLPELPGEWTPSTASPREMVVRMAATTGLVAGLAVAAELLGPWAGGMLAGLPVVASVLAVFTHRRHGTSATVALLHGMLAGMAGFVGFCTVVALLIVPAGTAPAFAAAALVAAALQTVVGLTLTPPAAPARRRRVGHYSGGARPSCFGNRPSPITQTARAPRASATTPRSSTSTRGVLGAG